MYVCKLNYCDFVVWSEKEGILLERLKFDETFFEFLVDDVKYFFLYGILPEIVGKWYTRKPISNFEGVVPFLQNFADKMI
jgi:hypothetical protein